MNLFVRDDLWARLGPFEIPPVPWPIELRHELHVTDIQVFTTCRRQWDWCSPLRRGLQPAKLPDPLTFGLVIHHALEFGYRGCCKADKMQFDTPAAMEALKDWFISYRARVVDHTGPLWPVEAERIDELEHLGKTMVLHYGLWVPSYDERLVLLDTEQFFELPVPGTLDLKYAGRFDGFVRDRSGHYWVLELKTAASLAANRLSGVFRSLQSSAYVWAARQLYDVPVSGILYRVLHKQEPAQPVWTKKNRFSYAKSIKSSVEWYNHCLSRMARKMAIKDDTKTRQEWGIQLRMAATQALTMLQARGNTFFLTKSFSKTSEQLTTVETILRVLGREMVNPNVETFAVPGYHCAYCTYKDPCDLAEAGMNANDLLDAEYARRDYWED